jgi:hypothetical protein
VQQGVEVDIRLALDYLADKQKVEADSQRLVDLVVDRGGLDDVANLHCAGKASLDYVGEVLVKEVVDGDKTAQVQAERNYGQDASSKALSPREEDRLMAEGLGQIALAAAGYSKRSGREEGVARSEVEVEEDSNWDPADTFVEVILATI